MKNTVFPHKFWRPFLDCMPQLFFRPQYVWFPVHLKGHLIPLCYETLVVNWQNWLFTLFHQSRSVLSPNPKICTSCHWFPIGLCLRVEFPLSTNSTAIIAVGAVVVDTKWCLVIIRTKDNMSPVGYYSCYNLCYPTLGCDIQGFGAMGLSVQYWPRWFQDFRRSDWLCHSEQMGPIWGYVPCQKKYFLCVK